MNTRRAAENDLPFQRSHRNFPFPTFILQPILRCIVMQIANRRPEVFERLGPHTQTSFVIDPVDFPFALYLQPNPANPAFKAIRRAAVPAHEARIAGNFLTLLRLVDAGEDGDALFFSRDLTILGNTEAVVSLRNALDDVDGSIAEDVADMFGPLGRFALNRCRKVAGTSRELGE